MRNLKGVDHLDRDRQVLLERRSCSSATEDSKENRDIKASWMSLVTMRKKI